MIFALQRSPRELTIMADENKSPIGAVGVRPSRNTKVPLQFSKSKEMGKDCKYCSFKHPKSKSPAYGKQCNKCGGLNSFDEVGKSASVKVVDSHDVGNQVNSYFIGTFDDINQPNPKCWVMELQIASSENSVSVNFQ